MLFDFSARESNVEEIKRVRRIGDLSRPHPVGRTGCDLDSPFVDVRGAGVVWVPAPSARATGEKPRAVGYMVAT